MENITLPPELLSFVNSEDIDFTVKAGRAQPLKQSFPLIILAVAFITFAIIAGFSFLGPIFQGKEVHFKYNGVPTVASPDKLEPIILPAIMLGVFLLSGIGIFLYGIYSIFKKGGYFVGTSTGLVHFQNGNIKFIDWKEFSGDIEITGNAQKGNILLRMRTGMMMRSRKSAPLYSDIPYFIYISEVPNVFEIAQICKKRIKENNPTLAQQYTALPNSEDEV